MFEKTENKRKRGRGIGPFFKNISFIKYPQCLQLLQAHAPEWALVQRHQSEDIFGIQVCGSSPQQMSRVAQLVQDGHIDCDFVDLNLVSTFQYNAPLIVIYQRSSEVLKLLIIRQLILQGNLEIWQLNFSFCDCVLRVS